MANNKPSKKTKINTMAADMKKNDPVTVSNVAQIELVDQANKELLSSKIRARNFFRQLVENTIQEQNLKYTYTPKDTNKEYPKLDIFGWFIVLDYIKINLEETGVLLDSTVRPRYNNSVHGFNSDSYKYNYNNVLCIMDVYIYLCSIYGFIPTGQGFIQMTGICQDVFWKWASTGKLNIIKKVDEIGKNGFIETFINSKIPLERIYTANNLYSLNNDAAAADEVPELETLPDLLSLPNGQKENCANNSNNVF